MVDRRKRVERLKKIIVISIAAGITVPLTLCVVMFFRIMSLNRQLDEMSEEVAALRENTAERPGIDEEVTGRATGKSSRIEDTGSTAENVGSAEKAGDNTVAEDSGETKKKDTGKEESKTKVYLTFDDGPSSNTGKILDILAQYDVKATFFVTGSEGPVSESLYRRIVDEGHTLGMHSYTHKYNEIYASKDAFAKDLQKLQDYLYDITGTWSRFYRFPGGSSNKVSKIPMKDLAAYLDSQDIYYLDWNIASGDATGAAVSAGELSKRVLGQIGAEKTQVVLMHDAAEKGSTVEALSIILEELTKRDDVEILPVSEDMDLGAVQHINSEGES